MLESSFTPHSFAALLQAVAVLPLLILVELNLHKVIANVPHDAGAVVAFGLLGSFIAFVWIGSRPKSGGPKGRTPNGE